MNIQRIVNSYEYLFLWAGKYMTKQVPNQAPSLHTIKWSYL